MQPWYPVVGPSDLYRDQLGVSPGSRYMKRMKDLHQDRLLTLCPPLLHADLGQPGHSLGQRQQGRQQLPHHKLPGGCGLAALSHNWPRHLHCDLLQPERGRELGVPFITIFLLANMETRTGPGSLMLSSDTTEPLCYLLCRSIFAV